jgi:hypothetical protein
VIVAPFAAIEEFDEDADIFHGEVINVRRQAIRSADQ